MKIKITDLKLDRSLQVRNGLNKAAVQRYIDSDGLLPPIDVFKLPDGIMVVVDGWHRIAAAKGRGENDIPCTVHKGTLKEAEAFAIVANCKHGLPLTKDERDQGILRLHALKWSSRQIATEMSVDHATALNVLKAAKVVKFHHDAEQLTTTHARAIADAPEDQWGALVNAAIKGNWSAGETVQAVANLADERVTDAERKKMLQGAAPIAFAPDGERAVTGATVRRVMGEPSPHDPSIAYSKVESAILSLMNWTPYDVLESIALEKRDLDSLLKDLPEQIGFLEAILSEGRKRQRKLTVVKA